MDIYKMNLFFKGKIGALVLLSSIVLIEPAGAVRLDMNDPTQIARIGAAARLLRYVPPIYDMIERVRSHTKPVLPRKDVLEDFLSSLSILVEPGTDGYKPLPALSIPFESLRAYLNIEVNKCSSPKLLELGQQAKKKALFAFQDALIKCLRDSGVCDGIDDGLPTKSGEQEKIESKEEATGVADLVWTGSGLYDKIWEGKGFSKWTNGELAVLKIRQISCLFSDSERHYFLNLIAILENKTFPRSPEDLGLASEFVRGIEKAFNVKSSVFIYEASSEIFPKPFSSVESFVRKVYGASYDKLLSYCDKLDQAKKSGTQDQPELPSDLSEPYSAAKENPVLFSRLKILVDRGSPPDEEALAFSLSATVGWCIEIWKYFCNISSDFEKIISCQDKPQERSEVDEPNLSDEERRQVPKIDASSACGQG